MTSTSRRLRLRAFAAALAFGTAACRPGTDPPAPKLSALTLFEDVANETGLDFRHFNGATGEFLFPEIMSAGAALFDYDGDGDLDVYAVQSDLLNPAKRVEEALVPVPKGWTRGNRLYRNLLSETGTLRFVDVTRESGTGLLDVGMGVAVGDYDGDGYPDLYVTAYGRNTLLQNDGNGHFRDVTDLAGVDDPRWSSSASFCDFDGDGWLDLFVTTYVAYTVQDDKHCFAVTGERDYCGPKAYRPGTSKLFRNRRNGSFEDVSDRSGIASVAGPGLGVVCADFNADGRPDYLVANDAAANHLWLNQGDGTFTEQALLAGIAFDAGGTPHAGMGIAVGDVDNDGSESVFISNLTREGGVLYSRSGDDLFVETSVVRGLQQATLNFTGFGTAWIDYDNDSWLDLFIANGAVNISTATNHTRFPFEQLNQLFHNEARLVASVR